MFEVSLFVLLALNYVCGGPVATPSENQYDVIVIGCGVSGLSATGELGRNGKRVICLEAADRIGGRVRTVPFGDGIVEMGAEWIHGTEGSKTYELALANNVSVQSQNMLTIKNFRSNLGSVDEDTNNALNKIVEYTLDVLEEPEKEEGTGEFVMRKINEYTKKNYPDIAKNDALMKEIFDLLNEIVNSIEATNDWNEPNANGSGKNLGGDLGMSWGRNGYKTLFEIILNKYNGGDGLPSVEILLNTEVTNIAWSDESVTVTTRNNTSYTAPLVIVTLSVGVLKERHQDLFTPSLPEKKIAAIKNIPIGVEGKIITAYDKIWWGNESTYSFLWREEDKKLVKDEDIWITRVVMVSKSMGSDNTLEFWAMGDAAKKMESLPIETVKEKITEILRLFMGKSYDIPEPSNILKTFWFTNPWTRGSYSYDPLGLPPSSRDDLAEPVKDIKGNTRLLFAGEATHKDLHSTVHGAYESGIREARRVIDMKN